MEFEILIPITLFICIVYAIKLVLDSRVRSKLMASNGSEELLRAMLQGEEQQRRHASLRWGISLVSLALAFLAIEIVGWDEVTPGVIAVLLGAVGAGNLASYAVLRRMK